MMAKCVVVDASITAPVVKAVVVQGQTVTWHMQQVVPMVSGQCDPVDEYVAVQVAGQTKQEVACQTQDVLVSVLQDVPSDSLIVPRSTVHMIH